MIKDKHVEFFGGGWRDTRSRNNDNNAKIIDAHFHIHPPIGGDPGSEGNKIASKLLQYHVRDYQTFWRRKDDRRVDKPLLDFASDNLDDMPDVDFRICDYGQAEFTLNGVDYYTQVFPPSLVNMEAAPERMIAEMNIADVDMSVLQHDHVYGSLNEYFGDCMRQFPGRFLGLAQIQECDADQDAQLKRLERAIVEEGNKGLYFSVESFARTYYVDHVDDAKFKPLWELVRQLEIPIWWYLDDRRRDRAGSFMERVAEMTRWCDAYPDIPSVLTHGIIPAAIIHDIGIPDEVMALLKRPNIYGEILSPAKWPEYPYHEGQEMIKRLAGEVGIEKLMWASDMPFCSGYWCTYKQSVDYIRVHCTFLTQEEKDLILGGNVARILKLFHE